jgi:DNA-binding response OmpR family regulator
VYNVKAFYLKLPAKSHHLETCLALMTIKGNELLDKRILLVDDDPTFLKLLGFAFAQAGCKVYTATDGQQGVRQVFNHRPDLVILDLMLPVMNGWETCRLIRQLSPVPIIIVTALGEKNNVIRGLEEGADDYVAKPFDVEILLAKARAILAGRPFRQHQTMPPLITMVIWRLIWRSGRCLCAASR